MNPVLTVCPVCHEHLAVRRLECRRCGTAIEGQFALGALSALTHEQLRFVELFVRLEGKLNRMEAELGLSYPTVRSRLHEIIRQMGFEPTTKEEPAAGLSAEERKGILEALEAGTIGADEAMRQLKERS